MFSDAIDPDGAVFDLHFIGDVSQPVFVFAKILGNTPAICRKCYVHPAVLETYLNGAMIEGLKRKTEQALRENEQDLQTVEVAVMKFLQSRVSDAKKAAA